MNTAEVGRHVYETHDDTVLTTNESMKYEGSRLVLSWINDRAEISKILSGLSLAVQNAPNKNEGTFLLVRIVRVLPL